MGSTSLASVRPYTTTWDAIATEKIVRGPETVVTAKRDKAAALKSMNRIMKKYRRSWTVVTDGLCAYPTAMKEIGNADPKRLVVASTIGRKIRVSLFDDESEPCSGSEAPRRSRNSAQFMLRFTTISTGNVISSPAKSTNRDARPRSSSGLRSWTDARSHSVLSRQTDAGCNRSPRAVRRVGEAHSIADKFCWCCCRQP
jgi:transposase-like protein